MKLVIGIGLLIIGISLDNGLKPYIGGGATGINIGLSLIGGSFIGSWLVDMFS